jgi:N-acetylglutamate synthase-like GNAT family acetyltransferase
MVEIRPFKPEDWGALLDLANQAVPFAFKENVAWLENRKSFDESRRIRRHYIAADNKIPVGYGCIEQQSDDAKWLRIYVVCSPDNLLGEVGARLYEIVLRNAQESGADYLWAQEYQQDQPIGKFFTGHGFEEVRRFTLPGELPMVVYQFDLKK